jgi:DNA-binding CsgD family transcriptional regulator
MTTKIERLLEVLPEGNSIESLGLLIDRIGEILDVRHVAYLAVSLGGQYAIENGTRSGPLDRNAGNWWRRGVTLAAGTYLQDWGKHYAESGYDRIDPNIEAAIRSFVPLNWKSLDWDGPKRKRLFNEAIDAGLGNQGYTIPIRGPDGQFAIFVVNNYCSDAQWENFIAQYKSDLLLIAHYFHQKVLEIEKLFGPIKTPPLSAREVDVLKSIASGRNRAKVADDLGISENTLRVYLDSARHKLNALNVSHAVAIAVQRGIITV